MRAGLVWGAFYSAFKQVFPDLEIIRTVEDLKGNPFDIIIFSGGEDISPEIYGETNELSYCNPARDAVEVPLLSHILEKETAKILGVCRGHQLINAMLGGKLFQDLGASGITHESGHPIFFSTGSTPLFFQNSKVNSLHHQGVYRSGILRSIASYNEISEISFDRGGVLTTQFHPEFLSGSDVEKFWSWIITSWIPSSITKTCRRELAVAARATVNTLQKRMEDKKDSKNKLFNLEGQYEA